MGERAYKINFNGKNQLVEPIRPTQSVQEIYGKGYVYNPKLYASDYKHFAGDLLSLEALTGRELSVIGEVPIICHAGVVTKPTLTLLRKTGLQIPTVLYTYKTDDEYIQLLKMLEKQNKKLIFQYPHPTDMITSDMYRNDPKLLLYLCDKKSIPELVPAENVPNRRMMSLDQILEKKPTLPIVLKTGDGRPTSGGCGVMLIKEDKQLNQIDESFGNLTEIIVEEYIKYDENISVHYVVNKQGNISFLGKSEQIINKDGCFRGSWITVDIEEKIANIIETGYEVMKNIAEKGYVGAAGFDVLICGDRYYFIDLNIRFNASTCGLFLYHELRKKYGKQIMRLCNLEWMNDFNKVIPIVEKYMSKNQFVPLSLLDAGYFPEEYQVSKVIGLIIGNSVQEVEGVMDSMAKDGLYSRE